MPCAVLAAMGARVELDAGCWRVLAGAHRALEECGRTSSRRPAGSIPTPQAAGRGLFDNSACPYKRQTSPPPTKGARTLPRDRPPLPQLLLEYRELSKLLGTYVQPLPSYLARSTGRLHASFHQTGAATGRLSSSDPNIQNIPIRTEAGREIRRAFRAGPDRNLVMADYSQVELRMLAHFSQDEELAKAFREGLDIHAYVASQIFGTPLEAVNSDQRRVAKTVNFGIIYGQSAFGLARTLRIPQKEAAAFIAAYKERYTGLERFLQACISEAEEKGYVTTILGRRRAIDDIRSRNRNLRHSASAWPSTRSSGRAADLIKVAMVQLMERLARSTRKRVC